MPRQRSDRRWASGPLPPRRALSINQYPSTSTMLSEDDDDEDEEFVEVTLDYHDDDDTVVLRSVEPASSSHTNVSSSGYYSDTVSSRSTASRKPTKRSPSMIVRSSSIKIKEFSRHLRDEFKAEIKKFTRVHTGKFDGGASGDVQPVAFSEIDRKLAQRENRRKEAQLVRCKSGAFKAMKGLKFIANTNRNNSWTEVEARFHELALGGWLARSDFGQCIGMREKEFALELFDALTRRRRMNAQKISKDELEDFWKQITDEGFDSRLQIFFGMVDKNEDGKITEVEVKEIIMLSASANNLARLKEQAEEYAALIMEELDPEGLGYIELWQLETLLLQKDTYLGYSQALNQTSTLMSQNLAGLRRNGVLKRLKNRVSYFLEEYWKRIWVMALWIGVMAGLFSWKYIQYRNRYAYEVMGRCLTTAKGAAETLKFNMALILLPVCRNTITWLRSTRLAKVVPFDDNINFHKTIAAAIVVGVILHVGNHLACDFPRLVHASEQAYAPLIKYFGETKPTYMALVRGPEGVTGISMLICMIIAFTLATRWFRRGVVKLPKPFDALTGYNAFWYSHHLFVLVYILLLVHGQYLYLIKDWYKKTTWMYLAVPVLLYSGERLLRALRSGSYSVRLLKVAIYPGSVLTIRMSKPAGFRYKSGQYMFVQCPAVSPFEWHPFSITSSPGDDYLSVHIRQLGDWTRELKQVFAQACEPPDGGKSGLLRADENTKRNMPKLNIDGPYGAPAQDYKKYDILLLVGLGIGATPFISILKDLLNNMVKMEEEADALADYIPSQQNGERIDLGTLLTITKPKWTFKTTNAYFYWVTREQGSFDWFKGVMNEIAELDQRGIIEMHNYLTSVYEEGDARSALITMLQALNQAKNGYDIVSGTRVRTHFARPNWKKVFSRIRKRHQYAKIGVFYCGAASLAQELSKECYEFNQKGKTKFVFHKEHF